jgi:hypothetical protein
LGAKLENHIECCFAGQVPFGALTSGGIRVYEVIRSLICSTRMSAWPGVTRKILDSQQVDETEADAVGARMLHGVLQVVRFGDASGSAAGTFELGDDVAEGFVLGDGEAAFSALSVTAALGFRQARQLVLEPNPLACGYVLDQPNCRSCLGLISRSWCCPA